MVKKVVSMWSFTIVFSLKYMLKNVRPLSPPPSRFTRSVPLQVKRHTYAPIGAYKWTSTNNALLTYSTRDGK